MEANVTLVEDEMDDASTRTTISATILGVSALATILLALCLAHTWKYWRQVRIYIILLLVGNVLNVAVMQGITLNAMLANGGGFAARSIGTCRFVMFATALSGSLPAHAVAALGLHVLLTSITGNQGNRLRHALVVGLMVLLALPMPLVKMSLSEVYSYSYGYEERRVCTYGLGVNHLAIGDAVTAFFPMCVSLLCSVASTVLIFCNTNKGTVKGDEDKSDLILAYLMGAVLLIFCAPAIIHNLVMEYSGRYDGNYMYIYFCLSYLMWSFPFVTALINIVFAYLRAHRSHAEIVPTSAASGERQRLVN